jgi:hypothetical protein
MAPEKQVFNQETDSHNWSNILNVFITHFFLIFILYVLHKCKSQLELQLDPYHWPPLTSINILPLNHVAFNPGQSRTSDSHPSINITGSTKRKLL